jgi:hypothetical protein
MGADLLAGVPLMDLQRAAGEAAGLACMDKAQEVAGFDPAGAALFIVGWLRRHGPQAGEKLTNAAVEHGYCPHDQRAFGPVYAGLARRGVIKCVGFCERQKGHGTAGGRIWGLA